MNTGIYSECGHFSLKYHCSVFSNGNEVILFFPLFPYYLLLTLQGEEYGGYRGRAITIPESFPVCVHAQSFSCV